MSINYNLTKNLINNPFDISSHKNFSSNLMKFKKFMPKTKYQRGSLLERLFKGLQEITYQKECN